MNILYITPDLPYPKSSGGRIKSSSTIEALIKLGHKITLVTFSESKSEGKYINILKQKGVYKVITFTNEIIEERSLYKKLARLARSIFSSKPYSLRRYYNKKMHEAINNCISKENYQVIWINNTHMSQYLPNGFNGIKIIETLDVESKLYKEALLYSFNTKAKFFYLYEWVKYTLYERITYKKFDILFSISVNDAKTLESKLTDKKIFILPPRINLKDIKRKEIEKNSLLYIGTLYWYPNRDGLLWFLNKVYPKIYKQIPRIKVRIIGPCLTNQKFIDLPGVNYLGLGLKDKIDKYISKSEIFICPIVYGSGIRTKILEAMSYSIPVVSTYKGVEGLKVKNGKELLLAKDEEEFAQKVITLSKNIHLQKKLSENGKKHIQKYYKEKILLERINLALNNVKH